MCVIVSYRYIYIYIYTMWLVGRTPLPFLRPHSVPWPQPAQFHNNHTDNNNNNNDNNNTLIIS